MNEMQRLYVNFGDYQKEKTPLDKDGSNTKRLGNLFRMYC